MPTSLTLGNADKNARLSDTNLDGVSQVSLGRGGDHLALRETAGDFDLLAHGFTDGDDSLLDLAALHDVHAAGARDRFDRSCGNEQRRSGDGLLNRRRGEESWLQPRVVIRRNRLSREGALIGLERGRDVTDGCHKGLVRIRVNGDLDA